MTATSRPDGTAARNTQLPHCSHVGGAGDGAGDTFDALATIEEAIRAGSDTVESLRRFSRKDADRTPEPGDVNRYADLALATVCNAR